MKIKRTLRLTALFTAALFVCMTLGACGAAKDRIIITEDSPITEDEPERAQSPEQAAKDTAESGEEEAAVLYVHVCGAVMSEGVYVLKKGQRIGDAVSLAGGMREDADTTAINLAMPVEDGMMVRVPVRAMSLADAEKETALIRYADEGPSGVTSQTRGRININTASETELCTLNGIGTSYARAIIAFRETSGGFRAIEDIKKVRGIGERTFEKIKDHITV